ncbi:hypothetical protein [Streptomyces sp. G-G2]|uniref:hypothetical protein n=1 Tax=Streptomyces sp. G-G2 TaxID=3046201 RepID=UPI0024BAA30C|nr:hypothetical protein [Streptomyces sp. G-G2]MDJ0386384.1 hypothetical protein [Streptomyces sp. G-G2]
MPVSTTAHPGGYAIMAATGVTATKSGDTWTVTLKDVDVMAAYDPGHKITLNGKIVCGDIVSTP